MQGGMIKFRIAFHKLKEKKYWQDHHTGVNKHGKNSSY
jgi:hypothetical protein